MEKKEMYKKKLKDLEGATWGCATHNPKWCKTCLFTKKFNGKKLPDNGHCDIYQTVLKPESILFEGKICEYYHNENDTSEEDEE